MSSLRNNIQKICGAYFLPSYCCKYGRAILHSSPPRAVENDLDMATDRTSTVSIHDRTPQRIPCPVCPQEPPGRFYHPQDVINRTLQESGATNTARDAMALALYLLEDVVSQLVRLYKEQANTKTTAQQRTGT